MVIIIITQVTELDSHRKFIERERRREWEGERKRGRKLWTEGERSRDGER